MRGFAGKWLACAAGLAVAVASGGAIAGHASAPAHARAPADDQDKPSRFELGKTYFGTNDYIEYIPGNAPVILTAPHGGTLMPEDIPTRTKDACGGSAVVARDTNTQELVRAMRDSFHARFGTYPHVIINRMARRKLDANRPADEAACGNRDAKRALREWHAFIDAAKAEVVRTNGRGWYIDVHGHGHKVQRLELGYLLTGDELDRPNAEIDANGALKDKVSVRALLGDKGSLSELLRGPTSLGTLYDKAGFPAVPSAGDAGPAGERYFGGGHNTRRHTCGSAAEKLGKATGGTICGLQIETNFRGVRDTPENRQRFGDATAEVLEQFLGAHWGIQLRQTNAGGGR